MAEKDALVHKDDILQIVCAQALDLMDFAIPVSCTCIAQRLGISVYAVRKCIHELAHEGYVEKGSYVYAPKDDVPRPPYNGWFMTTKAEETEAFKKAYKQEIDIRNRVFGF